MIKVSDIKYKGPHINYHEEKLTIKTPVVKSRGGIEKYFNKYELVLEIEDEDFLQLIRDIEENNKKHCSKEAFYRSNLMNMMGKYYLKTKVPHRYKRFEVDIESERIYLPTIEDITKDTKIKCDIEIPKTWHYRNDGKYLCGSIMEVKSIEII